MNYVTRICRQCNNPFTMRANRAGIPYYVKGFCTVGCANRYRSDNRPDYVAPATQVCRLCGDEKPASAYKLRLDNGRLRTECTLCLSNKEQARRWEKYGSSEAEYNRLFAEQEGKCAICGKDPEERHLSIDHDHETNKIRGLLCRWCNMGVGSFKDDEELLLKAAEYIKKRRGSE